MHNAAVLLKLSRIGAGECLDERPAGHPMNSSVCFREERQGENIIKVLHCHSMMHPSNDQHAWICDLSDFPTIKCLTLNAKLKFLTLNKGTSKSPLCLIQNQFVLSVISFPLFHLSKASHLLCSLNEFLFQRNSGMAA